MSKYTYRFSSDPETCMGLVQHEGGPCGVLATIQVNTVDIYYALFEAHGVCYVSLCVLIALSKSTSEANSN